MPRLLLAALVTVALFASTSLATAAEQDTRERLLGIAQATERDFPDGKTRQLTRFHYVGRVTTAMGQLLLVRQSSITKGSPAPKGEDEMVFFSEKGLVGRLPIVDGWYTEPLWCDGGRVFLRGRTKGLPTNSGGKINNGNVLDLSDGWGKRHMLDIQAEGSSGATVPSEADRAQELQSWDAK